MLMGHLDTVYPDGTVAARPMRFEGSEFSALAFAT